MKYIKAKFLIPLILIAGIVIYFGFFQDEEEEYITEVAAIGNVEQIVSVNGAVKSPSIIELRFQQSGKIEDIYFDIGDNIFEGDKIAALEAKLLEIDVERAKAGLAIVEAELNLQYAGPSNEEIRVSNAQIQEALINLKNAEEKYSDTLLSNTEKLKKAELELSNAEIALDKAEDDYEAYLASGVNTEEIAQTDLESAYDDSEAVVNDSIDTIKDSISAADSVLAIDDTSADDEFQDFKGVKAVTELNKAKVDYKQTKEELKNLEDYYDLVISTWTNDEVEQLLDIAKKSLTQTRDLLANTYAVLEGTLTDYNFTKADLDALKSSISTEQNYVTDNLSAVENLIQTILGYKLGITSAELSSGINIVSAEAAL
ncbi:hypothetical protein GF354_05525, partial [Candidatus Peregrinibacteria bacterium]|nr:hypothetical protein [Candidatus Peregrinibacteria bacterium]